VTELRGLDNSTFSTHVIPQHNAPSLYRPVLFTHFVIFLPILAALIPFSDDITCTIIYLVAFYFYSFAKVA